MNVEELRIGNYVECFGTRQISVIKKNKVKVYNENDGTIYYEYCPINSDALKPIALTEKWILAFGYKKIKGNNSTYSKSNYNDNSTIWNYRDYLHFQTGVKIDYVHQLQNLYFALTGEELKIK